MPPASTVPLAEARERYGLTLSCALDPSTLIGHLRLLFSHLWQPAEVPCPASGSRSRPGASDFDFSLFFNDQESVARHLFFAPQSQSAGQDLTCCCTLPAFLEQHGSC